MTFTAVTLTEAVGEALIAHLAPSTSVPMSTASVTGSCARGMSPRLPESHPAAARVDTGGSAMDAGVGVGGGGSGGSRSIGVREEQLVAGIERPTNPMTRDPAFILALRRGERVGGGDWSVGRWGEEEGGGRIGICRGAGIGEEWSGCLEGGEAV